MDGEDGKTEKRKINSGQKFGSLKALSNRVARRRKSADRKT